MMMVAAKLAQASLSYSTTAGGLDIEIGASMRTAGKSNDDNNTSVDASNTLSGISYSKSDSVTLATTYLTADDNENNDEYSEIGSSPRYTIATGLETRFTYHLMDVNDASNPTANGNGSYLTFSFKALL